MEALILLHHERYTDRPTCTPQWILWQYLQSILCMSTLLNSTQIMLILWLSQLRLHRKASHNFLEFCVTFPNFPDFSLINVKFPTFPYFPGFPGGWLSCMTADVNEVTRVCVCLCVFIIPILAEWLDAGNVWNASTRDTTSMFLQQSFTYMYTPLRTWCSQLKHASIGLGFYGSNPFIFEYRRAFVARSKLVDIII